MIFNHANLIGIFLLLMAAGGCGVSNAVITGTAASGTGATPSASASSGAGRAASPMLSEGSAGVGSSSVMPASTPAPAAAPIALAGASSTPQLPIAGSNAEAGTSGAAASPTTPTPAAVGCRTSKYSLAVRLTVDVNWDETIALMGGPGKGHFWSKLTIDPSTSKVSEFRSCGSLLPVLQGTAVAGNVMGFQRVPQATFDRPTMPTVSGGSATRIDATLTLDSGVLLMGLSLPDPAGPWPSASTHRSVMLLDADGDGKPGVTALVRNDGGFTGSPTSILQTERIDASYGASRMAYRTKLNDPACADTLQGTAELLMLDIMMVGCHVKNRDDCRPEEQMFIEEGRPKFRFGAAVASAAVIPIDATCAQAVAILDVPGP